MTLNSKGSRLTVEFRGRTLTVQHAGAHRAKVSTRLGRPRPSTLWITGPCNDLLGGGGPIKEEFLLGICMIYFAASAASHHVCNLSPILTTTANASA